MTPAHNMEEVRGSNPLSSTQATRPVLPLGRPAFCLYYEVHPRAAAGARASRLLWVLPPTIPLLRCATGARGAGVSLVAEVRDP